MLVWLFDWLVLFCFSREKESLYVVLTILEFTV